MLSFTVTSCVAGASLPLVARKRTFLGRPVDHLQLAAAAHERIALGAEPSTETDAETSTVTEQPAQSRRAKAQRRNAEGKFA